MMKGKKKRTVRFGKKYHIKKTRTSYFLGQQADPSIYERQEDRRLCLQASLRWESVHIFFTYKRQFLFLVIFWVRTLTVQQQPYIHFSHLFLFLDPP